MQDTNTAMASAGLLILTQPLPHLRGLIPKVIEEATVVVSDTLYVCLQPGTTNRQSDSSHFLRHVQSTREVQSFTKDFYMQGENICHHLDIRILLSHICKHKSSLGPQYYSLKEQVSVLMSDSKNLRDSWKSNRAFLLGQLKTQFTNVNDDLTFSFLNFGNGRQADAEEDNESIHTYPNVVIGGTFDRLHSGHKLLLTESCLRTEQKLTVGITDGERNKKKTLWELMQPYETRAKGIVDFVNDVKPSIVVEPVQIFDPFGPTITDPNLQCIIVSEETKAGGAMVNEERANRSFPLLDMYVIDLVDDACHVGGEEDKVSSSSLRRRLLGTLLQLIQPKPQISQRPYRIGITGGIASGKSNVCKELESLGAIVIDCDRLGHETYVKGTHIYHNIIEEFGQDLVQENGEINRRKLGQIVFSDKAKLEKLNSIVWPAIKELAEQKISCLQSGEKLVVLEAAVLLEAGWEDMVHEVWTTFIPRDEAVKRLMDRNKLEPAEAEKRLNSQISNSSRIAQSNIVICPQWEFEYTRQQVERAWDLLQKRIKEKLSLEI